MSSGAFLSLIAAVVALVVVVAVGIHRHQASGLPSYGASSQEPSGTATSPDDASFDGSSLVVDVEGKVRHPGLVTLPIGARVADAVKAAGGPSRHRDLAGIDLAQRVADGQLLTVGRKAGHSSADAASKLVHLSTASLTKLETLPGVGPVTAQKILDWRSAHGGFTSVSQLQEVSGIGPARYAELSPLVAP
jgi:competence protein ComEA